MSEELCYGCTQLNGGRPVTRAQCERGLRRASGEDVPEPEGASREGDVPRETQADV